MGHGQGDLHIFGEEQVITCNVQRVDAKKLTSLVQTIPNLYKLLSQRKKF